MHVHRQPDEDGLVVVQLCLWEGRVNIVRLDVISKAQKDARVPLTELLLLPDTKLHEFGDFCVNGLQPLAALDRLHRLPKVDQVFRGS